MTDVAASLEAIRERLSAAAILLDFDGTLAPIVPRPEDARPIEGAAGALERLVGRAAVVAIVTGRPSATIRELLPVDGVRVVGLYGFEDLPPVPASILEAVEGIAAGEPGATVERKGASVAVHVRNTPDPDGAGDRVHDALRPVAEQHGMRLLAGKRVWELAPADAGGKADAVTGLLAELRPEAALYAGDDVADLEAFEVLDRSGLVTVKIAVLGVETPPALEVSADLTVAGPPGLLAVLGSL